MKILTIEKAKVKAELEIVIKSGLASFMEVGAALAQIKANGLYKNEYPTFEKYCTEKWQLSRSHVYRKMEAFKVSKNVQNSGQIAPILPNEGQATELAKLPEGDQPKAWEAVIESAPKKDGKPKITAKLVKAAVDSKAKPAVKAYPRSKTLKRGELYEDVAEALAAKSEFNEILSHIAKANALAKALSEKPLGCHINWNRLEIDLKNVRGNIKIAMPYGPCPYCGQDGCKACNKQGWLTKMKIDAAGDQA